MGTGHALASPSGYDRWSRCAGSLALEANEPDTSSEYADEGTAAHFLAQHVLQHKKAVAEFAGRSIHVKDTGEAAFIPDEYNSPHPTFKVTDEMVTAIAAYVDAIRLRVEQFTTAGAKEVLLLVEQRLPIDKITGEKGAVGTTDALIIARMDNYSIIEVDDLKYGYRPVEAENNGQLMMYALSAKMKHEALHNFTEVICRIHQPRISDRPKEWSLTVADLDAFGEACSAQARMALQILEDGPVTAMGHLVAGDKQCKWCKAQTKCPEYAKFTHSTVFGDFEDISEVGEPITPETYVGPLEEFDAMLPMFMDRVPMIESWCLAIRARTEQRLLEGKPVGHYKLVMGKQGNRAWKDEDAVQTMLLAAQVHPDRIFAPRKMLTPAALEKSIGKTAPVLEQLKPLITQAPGKPSVAPGSDPREPWAPVQADEFKSFDGSDLA